MTSTNIANKIRQDTKGEVVSNFIPLELKAVKSKRYEIHKF